MAEEAAKRLLPDTNLERKAKPSGAHRGLAPMQADFWAKRGEAGDIYDLDPLLEEEEVNTRSAIERLVEELAHQGHSQRGRAVPTASSISGAEHLCVPRPRAADVISRVRNKKRQYISATTDKLVRSKTGFSTFSFRATRFSTRLSEYSGLAEAQFARHPCLRDSLVDRVTDHSSMPSCLPSVPRHFSESGGSFCASDPTVFSAGSNGPRAPLRSNFDDPDGWDSTGGPADPVRFSPGERDHACEQVDLV